MYLSGINIYSWRTCVEEAVEDDESLEAYYGVIYAELLCDFCVCAWDTLFAFLLGVTLYDEWADVLLFGWDCLCGDGFILKNKNKIN